jgi:hypothetical protein
MSEIENISPKPMASRKSMVLALVAAASGLVLSFGAMTLIKRVHVVPRSLAWTDLLAFFLGVTFFGGGLTLLVMSFNRRGLAESLEGAAAEIPASDEEVYAYRLQAVTLILAGPMLLLPLLAMGSLGATRQGAWLFFAAIVLLFALQTVANVLVWRTCDEFLRGQMLAVAAVTFAIGQAALFLWAAAEHLGLARRISSWEIITLLMTLYLVTGTFVAMHNRPSS